MSVPDYVLDTNVISALMRRHEGARAALYRALDLGATVYLCPVVRYEVLRGLICRDARSQMGELVHLIGVLERDAVHDADWDLAARLWADSVRSGRPHDDADLLIAAFAINRSATLVTNNAALFAHLPVSTESWLEAAPAP